jgi:hypothetical protein
MRLTRWTEGVNAAILGLVLAILLGRVEPLVGTWESDEFKQATAIDASLVLLIGCYSALLFLALANEMAVKTVAILDLENVRQDGMIQHVLADVLRVNQNVNTVSFEISLAANTRQHKQFSRFIASLRHDDLVLSTEGVFAAVRADDRNTNSLSALKIDPLRDC